MIDLDAGPCIVKRVSGCGVGTEYLAVTPGGDLYPCHQFVGDEKFRLGDIWNGIENKEILNQFNECNVYSHKECKDCFAAADVLPTLITQRAVLTEYMNSAVSFTESVLNVQLCLRLLKQKKI